MMFWVEFKVSEIFKGMPVVEFRYSQTIFFDVQYNVTYGSQTSGFINLYYDTR